MERSHGTVRSALLEREFEYLWFGSSGRPLVVFPTSGARCVECEERGVVAALADAIEEGRLQVCSIDAYDAESWYDMEIHPAERVRRHDAYDRFLSEELFPVVAGRAGRADTAVYGASLGGFSAVNFAARHPEQVRRCIAFSGFFDSRRLLDGHWDDLCYFHCPVCFVPNMGEEWVRRLAAVEWVLATGEHDSLADETRNFSHILRMKGIPVHSEIWPGVYGHDWPFWLTHVSRLVSDTSVCPRK